jgi:monofunctional biosynthetic peptidoglycan transglycosylase|tara:strand:+ start:1020 stop:1625 length:606 start_codon:yes stop_codon:yes gene_type:complete
MRTNTGLVVLFFALLTGCGEASITQVAPPAPPSAMKVLMEFTGNDRASWWIVNDDVMGGRSNSNISLTGDRTALFTGFVSLDNNGGFASARAGFPSLDLSAFKGVTLRIKGDGRKYQLRFSHAGSYSAVAHGVEFTTTPGEWIEIDLPFESFQPSYRGYVPRGIGPLDLTRLQQMTILIGDKKEGEFALEIDWVKAYHVSR